MRKEFAHDYAMRPSKSWSHEGPQDNEDDDVLAALKGTRTNRSIWRVDSGPSTLADNLTDARKSRPSISSDEESSRSKVKESGRLNLNYWRLPDLLRDTSGFQCQDPRNRLFAILPSFIHPIPRLLYPNYTKSTELVWEDLSWFLLDEGLPNALAYANGILNPDLPSWATDWTRLKVVPFHEIDQVKHSVCRAGYQAGTREIRPTRIERLVQLRSFVLGTVIEWIARRTYKLMINGVHGGSLGLEVSDNIATDRRRLAVNWNPNDLSKEQRFDDMAKETEPFFTYLVGALFNHQLINHDALSQPNIGSGPPYTRVFHVTDTTKAWDLVLDLPSTAPPLPSSSSSSSASSKFPFKKSLTIIDEYITFGCSDNFPVLNGPALGSSVVSLSFPGRRLFGRAAAPMNFGDEVCILLGFATPFIVRRAANGWGFVSQCHLFDEGIMSGRIVDNLDWDLIWSEPCPAPLLDFTFR